MKRFFDYSHPMLKFASALVMFLFSTGTWANAFSPDIHQALQLLATDAGASGAALTNILSRHMQKGTLSIVHKELRQSEGKIQVGTIGYDNGLQIIVDASQPKELVALTIAHEYMHLTTLDRLDEMIQTHPDLFIAILKGKAAVNRIINSPVDEIRRRDLKDAYTYIAFHFIDEAGAYLFEQHFAGKNLRPRQWSDLQLAEHIREQQAEFRFPPLPVSAGLKVITAVRNNATIPDALQSVLNERDVFEFLSK